MVWVSEYIIVSINAKNMWKYLNCDVDIIYTVTDYIISLMGLVTMLLYAYTNVKPQAHQSS